MDLQKQVFEGRTYDFELGSYNIRRKRKSLVQAKEEGSSTAAEAGVSQRNKESNLHSFLEPSKSYVISSVLTFLFCFSDP